MMSRARSEHTDNLILIAATTILILTAQRCFQTRAPEPPDPDTPEPRSPAATKGDDFTEELSQQGHGRRARSPFSIPWAGWKDILWRTYEEFNDDRLASDAYTLVDANVLFTSANERFTVNLWGKNLTDEFVWAGSFSVSTSRTIGGTIMPPRSYGLTLGYNL